MAIGEQAPELEARQCGDVERQQEQGGDAGWNVKHLHQPDQGHHLHQLKPKPQQEIEA